MSCIWQCDNCGEQRRATAWTCTDGWLYPPGWLVGSGMEIVCSEACAIGLSDRSEMICSTAVPREVQRPALTLVKGEA